MSSQPNFEKVKQAFYNVAISSDTMQTAVMLEFLTHRTPRVKAIAQFKKELNEWLDRLDIRMVYLIIDFLRQHDKSAIPSWIINNQYTIDYNKHICLDLIKYQGD